jgi:tRNA threonylcarbamoyladenosine biosynthesis protein TsaE
VKTYTVKTDSLEQTLELGKRLGETCRGGEVFELVSDLGGGKTAFVRGVVMGIGSTDEVSSPSFTINNSYDGGRLAVEHFDFYRLDDPGILGSELAEEIFSHDSVVLIEWGDRVVDILPDCRIKVSITVDESNSRTFVFNCPEELDYLFEGVS